MVPLQFFHVLSQDEFSESQIPCHSSVYWFALLHSIWSLSCSSPGFSLRFISCLSPGVSHGTHPYIPAVSLIPQCDKLPDISMTFQTWSLFCWHKSILSWRLISSTSIAFLTVFATVQHFWPQMCSNFLPPYQPIHLSRHQLGIP